MKKVTSFFWFCSGAHVNTLNKYPIEHNKYVGIGATIFFTALFATLSGGYAMYFVFSGSTLAVLVAMLFGIIWGLAIFNMDRYIVGSIAKSGKPFKQFLQALPRILLAIMIGVVISRPLELKIFNKEIEQKLKQTYLVNQQAKIDTLQKTFGQKYSQELGKNHDLKLERDSLTRDINRSRYQLNQEVFGDKSNQTSGIKGYGTYAKQKEAVLQEKQERLKIVQKDLNDNEAFLSKQKQTDGLTNNRLLTNTELDSLSSNAGFADRNRALSHLADNPNGTTDFATASAITFMSLLFILLECLPVLVKLMADRGPYDMALQYLDEAGKHFARKDRDLEMSLTDDLHPHRYNAEFNKRKLEL